MNARRFSLIASIVCFFNAATVHAEPWQVMITRDGDQTRVETRWPERRVALLLPYSGDRPVVTLDYESTNLAGADVESWPRVIEHEDADPCPTGSVVVSPDGTTMSIIARAPEVDTMSDPGGRDVPDVKAPDRKVVTAEYAKSIAPFLERLRLAGYAKPAPDTAADGMRYALVTIDFSAFPNVQMPESIQIDYRSAALVVPYLFLDDGDPDLTVFVVSRTGRAVAKNAPIAQLPAADSDLPWWVSKNASPFYEAVIDHASKNVSAVLIEAARELPYEASEDGSSTKFVTRLRLNDRKGLPGLALTETSDRTPFRWQYSLRQPYHLPTDCGKAGAAYQRKSAAQLEQEASALSALTGWSINEARQRIAEPSHPDP